jgi:hypothetical protein
MQTAQQALKYAVEKTIINVFYCICEFCWCIEEIKFTLELVTKTQSGSRGIALLSLQPRL